MDGCQNCIEICMDEPVLQNDFFGQGKSTLNVTRSKNTNIKFSKSYSFFRESGSSAALQWYPLMLTKQKKRIIVILHLEFIMSEKNV